MQKFSTAIVILFLFVAPVITASVAISDTGSSKEYSLAESDFFHRGPTVNLVTNNSATIFWRTESGTDSLVSYGLNSSLLESKFNSSLVTDHLMKLTGLEMGQKYYYQVESDGTQSQMYHFLTAPADGTEFKMIVAGDNRPGSEEAPVQPEAFSEIADMIVDDEPHIVVLTGDFVFRIVEDHEENLDIWKRFTDIADRIGHYAPVIGVIGNHDTAAHLGSLELEYYLDAFINVGTNTTYFSFDYAGTHLTVLDSEDENYPGRITGVQYDWLAADLSNSDATNKFVIAHRPLYPVNHIDSALDVNIEERDRLQELFENQNVKLFIAGHDHCYMRLVVNDVLHITTGGLGASLYESPWSHSEYHYIRMNVSDTSIQLAEITIDDVVGDSWELPYNGPILIQLRQMIAGKEYPAGKLPELFFSSVPTTESYSWDSSSNSSSLNGLPDAPGEHTLDIYVEDDSNRWSHESYVFTTREESETAPDTIPIEIVVIVIGIVGAISVVLIVVVMMKRK